MLCEEEWMFELNELYCVGVILPLHFADVKSWSYFTGNDDTQRAFQTGKIQEMLGLK